MIRGSRLQRTYITLTGSLSRSAPTKPQEPEQGVPEHGVRFLDLIAEHYHTGQRVLRAEER